MSMDSVKYHANLVIEALPSNWGDSSFPTLEEIVRDLDVPDRSEAALNHLIGSCNIRALGDVHIASMSWRDWLKRLEKLERACKRELKRQGKEAWQSKRRREQGQELERRKKAARAHAIRAKRTE